MARYTKMNPLDFKRMTWGAGIILNSFNPETWEYSPEDIIWATTGDNSFSATRDLTDLGEPINNCPEGTMQLQRANAWQAQISGTAVTITAETAAELLGNADIDGVDLTKIVLRNDLSVKDFHDKWLITNYSDLNGEKKGGCLALHIKNALSTDGFTGSFTKNGNGEFPYTFKAYYDINDMDAVPFEVYIKDGEEEEAVA